MVIELRQVTVFKNFLYSSKYCADTLPIMPHTVTTEVTESCTSPLLILCTFFTLIKYLRYLWVLSRHEAL